MCPQIQAGEFVDALEVYDGDVIEHPVTRDAMTVVAAVQNPLPVLNVLVLTAGVVKFDVLPDMNVDGKLGPDSSPREDLPVTPDRHVRRLWTYVPPPGYR